MADPLATILRLRRAAANAARRALAEATRHEIEAEAVRAECRETLAREAASAPTEAAHPAAQPFALWRPQASHAIEAANQACHRAAAARESARHELALRQGALKAAEFLSAEHRDAARQQAAKEDQKRLDEIRPGRTATGR